MVKNSINNKSKSSAKIGRPNTHSDLGGWLEKKLRSLESWPNVTMSDCQPHAVKHWKLEANLRASDRRYRLINDFRRNERNRHKRQMEKEALEAAKREAEL